MGITSSVMIYYGTNSVGRVATESRALR